MISKFLRIVSKRNSNNTKPNRNENGKHSFFEDYVTYFDVLNENNIM